MQRLEIMFIAIVGRINLPPSPALLRNGPATGIARAEGMPSCDRLPYSRTEHFVDVSPALPEMLQVLPGKLEKPLVLMFAD